MRTLRRASLALAVAGAALAPAVVLSQQPTTVTTTIEATADIQDPKQASISVTGDAAVADGVKLVVVLLHKDVKVEERITTAGAGKYVVKFGPWRNKILCAGTYEVQLVINATIQKESLKKACEGLKPSVEKVRFNVGNAADVQYREATVKKKMLDVLENIRLGYLELCQAGSYYRAELQLLNIDSRIVNVTEKQKQENVARYIKRKAEILPAWQEIARANWDERLKTTKYDWKTFRDQIVVSPFPVAEHKIEQLFQLYERWYKGMSTQIYKLCGQTPPADLTQEVDTDPLKLDEQIGATAHDCYTGLGYPSMPEWRVSDLSQAEKGNFKDGVWRSYVSKFEVRVPQDWLFYPGGNKPSIRLSLKPPEAKDAKAASLTIMAVEILDYATAESMKHLAQLAREMNRGRWRGAKEIKSENINAPDRTMPGTGTRPGIDSEFLIEDNVGGRALKLHCRYYQLFCRWHKRTYGLLCMCPQDDWAKNEETFKKTCVSFKVLDAPEFQPMKEDEMRALINKEGRDPTKAILEAQAHRREAEEQNKDKDAPKDPPKETPK